MTSADAELEAVTQFMYMAPIGLAQADPSGEISMLNPACAQLLLPLAPGGALTNLFDALESAMPDLRHRVQAFKGASGVVCDGERLPVRWTAGKKVQSRILSLTLLKLNPERIMGVLSDITVAEARERELSESQAWFNAIFSGIADYSLTTLDDVGRISRWNESIARLTGFGADVVGKPYEVFYPEEMRSPGRTLDRLRDATASGWSLSEGWINRSDGSRFWGSSLLAPLQSLTETGAESVLDPASPTSPAFSLIIRDISDLRESREALRRAVSCDHLTGVANRRAFFEAGEAACRHWSARPRPLCLVIVDADHFKEINDRFGHPAGDVVLKHLAGLLGTSFRASDLVARLGGEEFAVLLHEADLALASRLARQLCAAVSADAVSVEDAVVRYSVSCGIAEMDASARDLDQLIKRADRALYAAKANGRNRVETWTDALDAAASRRRT